MVREGEPTLGREGRGRRLMKNAPKSDLSSVYKEIKDWDKIT